MSSNIVANCSSPYSQTAAQNQVFVSTGSILNAFIGTEAFTTCFST